MLAISNDFYSTTSPTLACRSYMDVANKIASLVQISGVNFRVKQELVWLLDQIRMRYRLEPIGIKKIEGSDPVIVVGTGYVPQALVWYGSRITTKGKTISQYNVRSLNIPVAKGEKFVMRSGTAKILARRFTSETFKIIPSVSLLVDLLDFGKYTLAINDGEINLGGNKDFVPYIEENVRSEIYSFFENKALGGPDIVTPVIEKWFKEKSELVKYNRKFLERQKFIEDFYRKGSVVVCQLPMHAEYEYFFQEFEWQQNKFMPIGERVFFQRMEDLTERYPHIVGAYNIFRAKAEKVFSYNRNSTVYVREMNFFRLASGSDILSKAIPSLMFPTQRVPSEDEMITATAVKPVVEESATSVLNF